MKFKIISYNVLAGFCDWNFKVETKPKLNKKRLDAAKKLIKKENPDILCLTEAFFATKNYLGIYVDYQDIFNYPYIDIRGSIVLLSKFPIKYSKQLGDNETEGVGLMAFLKTKKRELNVNVVPPKVEISDSNRTKLLRELFNRYKRAEIVVGDFNSISSSDSYTKEFVKNFKNKVLINGFVKMNESEANKIINDMLGGKLIRFVKLKGFIDTYKVHNKEFDFTIPTNLLSKDKSTGIRIDYIFCRKHIKILESGIIKNSLAEKSSDHYPVYAVLEI